jgi:hypothetical protein
VPARSVAAAEFNETDAVPEPEEGMDIQDADGWAVQFTFWPDVEVIETV